MTPEQRMWLYLRKTIGARWSADRHENAFGKGMPDTSFGACGVNGWIELKYLRSWPKRSGTKVKLKHFTPEQKAWLINRQRFGGHCWLLLKVKTAWLLFHPKMFPLIGNTASIELLSLATAKWVGKIDPDEFIQTIVN